MAASTSILCGVGEGGCEEGQEEGRSKRCMSDLSVLQSVVYDTSHNNQEEGQRTKKPSPSPPATSQLWVHR